MFHINLSDYNTNVPVLWGIVLWEKKNVNPPLAIIPYPMTYGEVQLRKHMHQILDLEL